MLPKRVNDTLKVIGLTLLTLALLIIFLMPLVYGLTTSLKTDAQMAFVNAPLLWPALPRTYTYEGEVYDVYKVPVVSESGQAEIHEWALVEKKRGESYFVDPANPDAGPIRWEGEWRQLSPAWQSGAHPENFLQAWARIDYPKLLKNTVLYAVISTFGAVCSAAVVAYGFARFEFPRKNLLFYVVMATIILPPAVTLVPSYFFYHQIRWVGTYLPLIVPVYFANGYNILLLRQFFLTIPHELDEAATIDGAGPFRIFTSIILPNAKPAIMTVILFHFFYAWNDFFNPMIYLAGKPELEPITVGLTRFNSLFYQNESLIQAGSLIALVVPFVVFFLAQRFFMQGLVVTGVEK